MFRFISFFSFFFCLIAYVISTVYYAETLQNPELRKYADAVWVLWVVIGMSFVFSMVKDLPEFVFWLKRLKRKGG